MKQKEEFITEEKVINTPAGGVLIGKKKEGQTIIHNDGSLGGFLIGRLHKDGGIKAINKATGQPLEMQSNEIVITAPAVADTTKRNFEGKMMTNREILSKINSDGGGVSFADGGDIPAKIHTTDKKYEYGGKMVHDSDIANSLGMNSTLKKGKQHFSSGGKTYDVDAIYNAVKKNKLHLKTKEVPTFAMKYPVYDKQYSETVKTDFRKPNGITVRTDSGEEVLIDGNHRMNNAFLKGKKTMKTYYIDDPKQIAKFTKNSKFELGGENKMSKKEKQEIIDSQNKFWESNDIYKLSSDALYVLRKDNNLNPPKYKRYQNFEDFYSDIKTRERNSIESENAKKVFDYLEANGAELQNKSIYGSRYYFYKGEPIRVSNHWQTSEIKDSETGLNKYRNLSSFYSDEKEGWKKMINEIEQFVSEKSFESGGENNDFKKLIEEKFSEGYGKIKHFELNSSGGSWSYINNPNVTRSQRDKMPIYTVELANDIKDKATEIKKNYEISQPKEISILQFAQKFAKNNNGKIYHKSKSGSVYVRVKDKEIRISDHNILDRDFMNPKNRYDLEIIQRYFDEKTPSNLDYWTDEFKNGGHLSKGKSLKQIAEMHNVSLAHVNEELAKGLEVEKEHFADFKERTRVAKDHLVENPNYYSILEKAGLEKGGKIEKDDLVKDAKSGNTPARDLNNYNDLMDVQADGEVGGDSGIFADGGVTPYDANQEGDSFPILITGGGLGLPKVAYVKVSNAGSSLYNLVGNKYNSYIEFAESVEDAYKKLGKTVRSFVELEAFDENDEKLLSVSSYVSNQKNTVKNFNPITGNYKNLEKSLQNSRPRTFQKFDWEDWLLSRVKPSTNSSSTTIQTPASTTTKDNSVNRIAVTYDSRVGTKNGLALKNNTLELYEFLRGLQFGNSENVKIQPVGNQLGVYPVSVDLNSYIFDNILRNTPQESALKEINRFLYSFYPDLDFDAFVKATGSATATQTSTSKTPASTSFLPLDLSDTKVWIGDDIRLSEAIQEVAFGLGWAWSIGGKNVKYTDANYLVFNSMKFIGVKRDGREGFDANVSREINPQDILLAKKPTITTTQTPASSSVKTFDFTDTKIDVKNNPDLSLKVQKKAFEDGWEWEKGGGKTLDYNSFNYLYFTKTSISSGNTTTSFVNSPKREITEADIFGSQAPTSTTATNKSVNNDVQSVLITYSGGQTLTALNEESLLAKIVMLWKNNGNSTMSINLQPQGNVQQLSTPLTVILDTIRTSKTSVQPSSLKNSELREYLSKDWYPELDWSYFFKEVKNTASNKDNTVDVVTLEYQLGTNYYDDKRFKRGEDLLEDFAKIEYYCVNNPDATVRVKLTAEVVEKTGKITSKTERIDIGKNAFKPSNFSYEEIKELIQEKWFDNQLDFSLFFGTKKTPTANLVVPKTTEKAVSDLDEAVKVLEKASAKVAIEYNKEVYEQSLKFLYDTKATYELALKFTPESAFMYERLDIMKKLADIEKSIKKIEDMKKGGAFFMLAKIIEKLQRGENWRMLENSEDVITNQLPQSEIDVIIRSQKFKNWFGNWEKALVNDEYDNVSKALTNGLPSVYHHGARRIKYTYREVSNGVLYLAENISYALWFSQNATAQTEEGNYLTECFVNIKNPIDLTAFRVKEIDFGDLIKYIDAIYPLANIYDFVGNQVALLVKTNQPTNIRMRAWQLIRSYAKFVNHIKENTPYDGFLYYENNPSDQVVNPATGQSEENVTKAVAIFKSHQVKVVDAVLFDGGLDDWRFENGGKLNN